MRVNILPAPECPKHLLFLTISKDTETGSPKPNNLIWWHLHISLIRPSANNYSPFLGVFFVLILLFNWLCLLSIQTVHAFFIGVRVLHVRWQKIKWSEINHFYEYTLHEVVMQSWQQKIKTTFFKTDYLFNICIYLYSCVYLGSMFISLLLWLIHICAWICIYIYIYTYLF